MKNDENSKEPTAKKSMLWSYDCDNDTTQTHVMIFFKNFRVVFRIIRLRYNHLFAATPLIFSTSTTKRRKHEGKTQLRKTERESERERERERGTIERINERNE